MKNEFVNNGKKQMVVFVQKAINDMLDILDSSIVFPKDMSGAIIEQRILQVVKSREQVYLSTNNMIDMIDIDNLVFLNRIIKGLKTTRFELTKIVNRDIGTSGSSEEEILHARMSIEDNFLSNVAMAKELASKVSFQILDRIDRLEMTEDDFKKLQKETYNTLSIENFAENR